MNSIDNNSKSYWTCASILIMLVTSISSTIGAAHPVSRSHFTVLSTQDIKELKLAVSVTDKKGNPVKGLPQNAFSVLNGKVSQEITSFDNQDAPSSVAIIFDLSGMVDDRGQANRQARNILDGLTQFIRASHESNEYFIIAGSNREPRFLLDGVDDPDVAISALNKLASWPRPGSADFMDALHVGITKVSHGKFSKQAIITVTNDNMTYRLGDFFAQYSYKDVVSLINEKGVLVYTLYMFRDGTSDSEIESFMRGESPRPIFKDFADFSGGLQLHTKSTRETDEYLERIAAELRHQYIIGFRPTAAAKHGNCYSFKVKLMPATDGSYKASSLAVRNRQIYCPNYRESGHTGSNKRFQRTGFSMPLIDSLPHDAVVVRPLKRGVRWLSQGEQRNA